MSSKDNFNQAMFSLFGIGKEGEPAEEAASAAETKAEAAEIEEPAPAAKFIRKEDAPSSPVYNNNKNNTYIAAGSSFEGTLQSSGNVEIAGEFRGDITAGGYVILRTNITGNIAADTVDLYDCNLTGDVRTNKRILIDDNSIIKGNVFAQEMECAGKIVGDIDITGDLSLKPQAEIYGNIRTMTMTMARGAKIKGNVETIVPEG